MNCWKSININRQYGVHRITGVSLIITLLAFIMIFLSFNLIFSQQDVSSKYFSLFLLALICIPTTHKLFHALPVVLSKKKVCFSWRLQYCLPFLTIKSEQPFSKFQSYVIFLMPVIAITAILTVLTFMLPAYFHYISILLAFNIGLSVPDFLYLKQINSAPRACQIEEIENGYDILIMNED
ncbi:MULTISPECIES: DUF3267 domain-containing protein [Sutcliffiella]|uniref:DUF3267 domain-containing protein n=1 Tax=Sutcliffiella cohnii TaxID=33932 RepID=A0A223KM61_9BACI|nr:MULTISPECIES: DUF3267 domain-containing protein [Sutcliffiella]AST90486.1 hypothetical protein BC6307_03945 [Sutcliffiella cohnii]MED4017395.1 DUF3267 domain-containing protein [Sutcliffiella cohnii]WBL16138.1 DUF3267 domain-containing protein [Sutcliffiella sp. NC1]